jgi:glutamate N-acetyltransferase/amino-acid N-acetyltransferase
MLTTDTVRKEAVAAFPRGTVGGMAKGAAMLAPSMATMLAVLATDVAIAPAPLTRALQTAVSSSFNALVVDACQSTNDTVLVLANGATGNEPITNTKGLAYAAIVEALTAACADLAHQMATDAEGATKCVTLHVRGARNDHEARLAARQVASSQLVQCSLYGKDPYWGRIISELGVSGAVFDPEHVTIAYEGVVVCERGIAAAHDAAAVTKAMEQRDLTISCDLHHGNGEATMLFTDLTHAYVDENMGTS